MKTSLKTDIFWFFCCIQLYIGIEKFTYRICFLSLLYMFMHVWFVYLMISTVAWSIADFLSKVLFEKHHGLTVWGYLVASRLIEIVLLFVFVLVWKQEVAAQMYTSWLFWWLLLGTFVVRFGGNILYYTSMRRLEASVVTVLFTSSTIVTVTLGIIFYGESLGWMKWVGVALTIGAILLLHSHIEWKHKQHPLFWFVLWSAVLYAIAANIEKTVWLAFDPFVFRLWYSMLSVLWLLFVYKEDITHDLKYIHHTSFRVINAISAVLFFIMNISYYFSFATGAEAGKVDAINNIGIFFIILLEILIFRDRERLWIKIVAWALSCVWVRLLYL